MITVWVIYYPPSLIVVMVTLGFVWHCCLTFLYLSIDISCPIKASLETLEIAISRFFTGHMPFLMLNTLKLLRAICSIHVLHVCIRDGLISDAVITRFCWISNLMPRAYYCLFVGGYVCLCVCVWVCYHDNSKLHASILTKLGL